MTNAESIRERAERLADLLDAESAEAEDLRRLTDRVMAEATEADLFRMVVPTRFGGQGAGSQDLIDTTRILAMGCPASAWTLSFLVMHNWLVTRFPAEFQHEVFGSEPGLCTDARTTRTDREATCCYRTRR